MRQDYGFGALIVLTISLGVAAVAYGGGYLPFDIYNFPAWIFGPLAVYTIVTSFFRRDVFSNLGWGFVFLAIAGASIVYRLVNVVVVMGFLLIAVGLLASLAYLRSRRNLVKT